MGQATTMGLLLAIPQQINYDTTLFVETVNYFFLVN